MQRILLIAPLFLAIYFAGFGQTNNNGASSILVPKTANGKGTISGIVKDSLTKQPVSYATISLKDAVSGKLVDGNITDDDGKFELKGIATGNYLIEIDFIGYRKRTISNVSISEDKPAVKLGTLSMNLDTKQLKEVEIQAQKNLIEEKVDRTVYNAENDATTRGGDATDVLKRVPLLSVDMDGNVTLRGSSDLKVLINNRPSTISAGSIADALKQIPADQIKTVEVITSPSSKYDAEGSAGIINIILKKNSLEGMFLSADASTGIRGSLLGINGNYNKKNMRFSLNGFGRAGYNIPGSFSNSQITTAPATGISTLNVQQANTRNDNINPKYTFGWEYDLNDRNFLTTSVQYSARNNYTYQDLLSTNTSINDSLISSSLRNVKLQNTFSTWDINTNFTHKFSKPDREISFLGIYSLNNTGYDFYNYILNPQNQAVQSILKNSNPGTNREISFQVDYQTPFWKKQTFETGVKNTIRNASSGYNYYKAGSDGDFSPIPGAALNNNFNYNQNIAAAYGSFSTSLFDKYNLKAGLRDEYTTINASFSTGTAQSIPSYNVLVPSINISRKYKNGSMLKAAYNRRIQRPTLQFLNPNLQASNPLSTTVGNPYLRPEYTNNYELTYSAPIKQSYLTVSAFMRNNTYDIQPIRKISGDTVSTTYYNIGVENNYGVNLFYNINLSNQFSINAGGDLFYRTIKNNDPNPEYTASNHGWMYRGRLMGSYNISKLWAFQAFAFYNGRQVQLQGLQTGYYMYSLVLKKDLRNKKGSFGFGAENFITNAINVRTTVESSTINQTTHTVYHALNFKITFSYKIGKVNTKEEPKKKKSIEGEDQNDGGGDSGPAGGMPQPGGSGGGSAPRR